MVDPQSNQNATPEGGLSAVQNKGGLSDAGHTEMTPYEIVKEDISKFKVELDPDQTYAKLLELVKEPNYRVVRANDSIILIDNHMDGTADGMMFTADSPKTFIKSLKQFNGAFKAAKVDQITFGASGMAIEPLLKRAGLEFESEPIEGGSKITVYAT